jgi:WD40 repeat protein
VAFSHDGKTLASGYLDKTVKLWNVISKRDIRTLTGHDSSLGTLAFSPNDQLLAGCGGPDAHDIQIWDVKTGKKLQALKGHTSDIYSLTWSPDGKRLASSGDDGGIRIWDTTKWKQVVHLQLKKDELAYCLAFSPDGKTLASGTSDRAVFLWEVSTWRAQHILKGHAGRIISLAFAGNSHSLVSGSSDKTFRIWDLNTRKMLTCVNVSDNTRALAISPDGKRLAIGHFDGVVTLWDVASGKRLRTLKGHTAVVTDLMFSPVGRFLGSSSQDGTIRIWDLSVLLDRNRK